MRVARTATYRLTGGLNLSASAHSVAAGQALIALNYELDIDGAYSRIEGYELFDGHPRPSDFSAETYTDYDEYITLMKAGVTAATGLIAAVPGSGPVRGVAMFKGTIYAWRDNAAADELKMYKSSATGWVEVVTPVLSPGGRVECITYNFQANASGEKLYGVDGVNKIFEFDGTIYNQPATSPVLTEEPRHLAVYANHLFLAYTDGLMINSSISDPLVYSSISGSVQWGLSGDINALSVQPGGALAVMCSNRIEMIYGNHKDDFQKVVHSQTTGAKQWSVQELTTAIYLDDRGIAELSRTQAFGNFSYATLSQNIRPFMTKFINRVVGSVVVRKKNQYRLFFDNGEGLIGTFGTNGLLGWTHFQLPDVGSCFFSGEDASGEERVFMGTESGEVMELDRGRSFNGSAILGLYRPAYMHQGAPDGYKKYISISLESTAVERSSIQMHIDFDYSSGDVPKASRVIMDEIIGAGGYFNVANFNEINFSTPVVSRQPLHITGDATSLGCLFISDSDFELPHTLQSITVKYRILGRVL